MRRSSTPRRTADQTLAYAAACVSLVLAVGSLAPAGAPRTLAWVLGAGVAVALATPYLRRATAASAVDITAAAAVASLACVLALAGASVATGLAASRAGDVGSPWGWLFSTSMWCLAAGLVASGRLVTGDALRCGVLDGRGRRRSDVLALLASGGFFIVGAVPVGAGHVSDVIHDQSAILAMVAFWIGMVATARAGGMPPALRRFSAASAVLVPLCWAPIEAKMIGLIAEAPVRTLHMQTLIFVLSVVWYAWLARELARAAHAPALDRRIAGARPIGTRLAGR